MVQDEQAVLIRKCKLWADLSESEYEELDVLDNFKEVKKGEYIYFEAFHHNIIYFIKKGHIRIGRINEDGTEQTKDILNPGDFFGQFTLERNNLDGEFAQAIKSDISLCSFTIENFIYLLTKKPQISIKFSKLAGLRFRKFQNRLLNILQKDVRTRLLLFLHELLQDNMENRKVFGDSMSIPNYLTHDEIAQLIGSARQTVTTLLNELKEEGIVGFYRKEIHFLNVSKHFTPGIIKGL